MERNPPDCWVLAGCFPMIWPNQRIINKIRKTNKLLESAEEKNCLPATNDTQVRNHDNFWQSVDI